MTATELLEKIKAEIERRISVNKTKNGFPAGTKGKFVLIRRRNPPSKPEQSGQ